MRHVVFAVALVAGAGATISSDEILAKVADSTAGRRALSYSGLREYKLRNQRIGKEALLVARVTYHPLEGLRYTILERSGSPMLSGIIERLLAYESEESKPSNHLSHEINSSNYRSHFRGVENDERGRSCYVLDLTPKHNNKHLIKGTLWVDSGTYAVVRLEGRTSASVSMWLGAPRISEEFVEIAGLWLPSHMRAVSSGFLLGASELEIRYSEYRIEDRERALRLENQQ